MMARYPGRSSSYSFSSSIMEDEFEDDDENEDEEELSGGERMRLPP
jgi:hypothetical protein